MHFPATFKGLKEAFMHADPPALSDLAGEYLVDMLTVFPSFKRFSHRKVFYKEKEAVLGYNVLFGKKWGHFFMEERVSGPDQKTMAVINYNRQDNPLIIRGIRDQIRSVEKGEIYIGRFNYLIQSRLIFLGYFSLERM